jgi:hypothetical protein
MACQIHRTKDGKINNVTTPTGAKSKLFEAIHSNIFLADAETSVKIYNNAHSEKIEKMFEGATSNKYDTGEPQLFYKSPSNKVYDNLEEVLIFEELGEISMGFKNPSNEEFMPVAKFTNKGSAKNEFLAAKVREGLLSADRVLGADGVTRFQGKGQYKSTRRGTAIFVEADLKSELGNGRVKVLDNGTIEVEFATDYSEAIDSNGNTIAVRTENIPEFIQKNPNTENKVELMIEYVSRFDNPDPIDSDSKRADTVVITNLKGIEDSLMGFLESLGISTTSLENYRKDYKTRYGEGTDISALADIANKVIAFRDGKITAEDLSEEVAHIAIEAFSDQGSITAALANVHLTPEYTELSEKYRNRYSEDGLSKTELEDKVRKEILGKLLKKEIISRFSTENKTSEEAYLTSKLKAIWDYFMGLLKVNTKSYQVSLLNDINKDIADSILNKKSEDFSQELIENNKGYFYSLMEEEGKIIHDKLREARGHLETLYTNYLEEPSPNLKNLDNLSDAIAEHKAISAVNTVVSATQAQMRILKRAAKSASENKSRLSMKDRRRYEVLKRDLIPTVNLLISELNKNKEHFQENEHSKSLLNDLTRLNEASEKLSADMGIAEPAVNTDKIAWVDRMLLKILDHTSLTEEEKVKVKASLDGGMRDIGFLGKMFGLSSHSRNIALQLMHYSVMNITSRTNKKFLGRMNEILQNVDTTSAAGRKHQTAIIQKDENGNDTFFLIGPRDFAYEAKILKEKKIQILSRLTDRKVEEIKKDLEVKLLSEILNEEQLTEYETEMNKFTQEEVRERRYLPAYYEARDEKYKLAEVSDETKSYLSTKNSDMNFRHVEGGHVRPDGTKDLSNQTEEERELDQEDKHRHKLMASAYDTLGQVKPGLSVVDVSELTQAQRDSMPIPISDTYKGKVTVLSDGMTAEELRKNYPDSRVTLDIFNLNMLYRNNLEESEGGAVEAFFKEIQDIEDMGGVAYDWLLSNSTLAVTSSFYEGMAEKDSLNTIIQEKYIDKIEDARKRSSIQVQFNEIKELKASRSALLSQNKKANDSTEYDANHMSDPVRSRVLELDTEIYNKTRALSIPSEIYDELGENASENKLGEDFELMRLESGLSAYEFARTHAPAHGVEKIASFARAIDDYVSGRSTDIKPEYEEFIGKVTEKGLLDDSNLSNEELKELLKGEFAKEHVASYFKNFAPAGFKKAQDALKSGEVSIAKFLENKEEFLEEYPALQYMEFRPDYTWRAEVSNEDMLNPNHKAADSFYSQPKKLNAQFFDRYFLDPKQAERDYLALKEEDLSLLTPTKNQAEYEYLKTTVDINKEIIGNYSMTGKTNPYLRVQMKKETFERAATLIKSPNKTGELKDWLGDIAKSQVDEMEYGQLIEETALTIKQIPKYYQQMVEDPSFLTQNTLQASLMSLKASIKYKERITAEIDVKAIEEKISQQKFRSTTGNSIRSRILKKHETSNYYAKAQEMSDYHLYGIKQNRKMITTIGGREVDFTQVITKFTNYVRNVNLAYNPLVDITSYTTGLYNNAIDTVAGDYYHRSSAAEASRVLPRLAMQYMSEEGNIKKSSELNHLLEWLNVFSEEERIQMSAYSRGIRVLSNSYYLGSKFANIPITPKNALAILYDTKFHNGRFKSYNEFARDIRNELGKETSRKEIEAKWKSNKETFYSNLSIDSANGITMGENFKEKFGEKAEEEFDFYHEKLTAKITQINQSVDSIVSNEDQTMAQRDALTNATLMHRGWFMINLTRKFKAKQFNIATSQFEEGHYRSILSVLRKLKGSAKMNKADRESLSEIFEEHEVRNLIRAGVDMVGIALLVALTNALLDDDDDDETYLGKLAQLIAVRTTNETQSQHMIGLYGTVKDMYKEPLVQRRLVEDVLFGAIPAVKGLAGAELSTKEKGLEGKFWRQNIIGRRRSQLWDLEAMVNTYMKYNKDQLWGVEAAQNMPDPF